jgi:HEPN domain-containing protein
MDAIILIIGILVGLTLVARKICLREEQKAPQRPMIRPSPSFQHTPPQLPTTTTYTPNPPFRRLDESVADILRAAAREADTVQRTPRPVLPRQGQAGNDAVDVKKILENFRRSVTGLIRLAESNLQAARTQAAMMNYKGAAELAATSVENVSRALLHCYGEKPDQSAGQEEPLRLLARRLQGDEKARFEKAIGEAAQLYRNKLVQAYLSEKGIRAPLLSEDRTQQMLETASRIVAQFRQIIDEHFAAEIPELDERCPKCGALTLGVWSFGPQGSSYQCNICGHKWIQPTL